MGFMFGRGFDSPRLHKKVHRWWTFFCSRGVERFAQTWPVDKNVHWTFSLLNVLPGSSVIVLDAFGIIVGIVFVLEGFNALRKE
ncbi:MAG: hypothetical protein ACI8XB_000017 [Patiriisocius sp.]|jgi:hypothetical protein